uniref:Reverse transcriptase domain-containing protein n=1 Tax=Tanacetum cinerariifolium TaxID=118510 RepID=A0A699I5M1_TANCI|nr:hypothetical protein [Tanacetum cinerariifolium]
MAQPPSPDHTADILEVEPVQLEIAPAAPELAPQSPNHVFNFPNGNPEEEDGPKEDPKEESEKELEEQEPKEMEMDDAELIFLYDAPGSPCPPASKSEYEPKDETAATVGTITQLPSTGRRFPSSIHVRGGSSSTALIAYDLEDLVSSYMRKDIDSLDGKEMIQVGAVREERPSEAVDVLATFGETPPSEPRGSPRARGPIGGARGPAGGARGPAGGAGGPAAAPAVRECAFASFMKCNPTLFHGTKGVVELCRWFKNMEMVFSTEGKNVKFATATYMVVS